MGGMDIDKIEGLSNRQIMRLKDRQDELKGLIELDLKSLEDQPEQRHKKEHELIDEFKELVKGNFTPYDIMNMDVDKIKGLSENEKGKLKVIQHELEELNEQDLDDLEDNPDQRHK